ncbi:hypothetical protein BDV37DRAFT_275645 [Aspergillus pseudonomiae]|uniref:Uncharacterized protein n=1 Tax=Aspergillus pseudonomiae TaxID=1506151 RepID=A0A5N7CXT9_9EURO|nr:uncharacterized protein BDV37DRAFT_275645 [Aspergillus pseudonomiae]KAE8399016.1 hypothetical protein BDV37DRAFT_275645 [Aspergillus pseudonomiae]
MFAKHHPFSVVNEVTSWNFRHGCLENLQLKEWLQQTGSFSIPSYPLSEQPTGGIRLLICNYTLFERTSLGMSREDYNLVESMLALHPATLSALEVNGGMFSPIILKAPQKYEIANYMLSLTHDTSSQWTTALLAGEDIIDLFPSMEDYRSERPFRFQVPGRTIRTSLAESPELWNNPLTLPCILITDHLKRVQQFCTGSLTQQVMVIEEHLGVTMVGRRNQPRFRVPTNRTLSKDADMLNLGIPVDRSQTHFLTVSINSKLTSILFTRRSPKWNYEASQFLLNIMNEASGEWHGQHSRYNQINELIEHNIYLAKSIEEHVLCLQARMELQLDVPGVPLTAITLGGWALWWNFEKHRYDVHMREANEGLYDFGPLCKAFRAEAPGFVFLSSDGVRPG